MEYRINVFIFLEVLMSHGIYASGFSLTSCDICQTSANIIPGIISHLWMPRHLYVWRTHPRVLGS